MERTARQSLQGISLGYPAQGVPMANGTQAAGVGGQQAYRQSLANSGIAPQFPQQVGLGLQGLQAPAARGTPTSSAAVDGSAAAPQSNPCLYTAPASGMMPVSSVAAYVKWAVCLQEKLQVVYHNRNELAQLVSKFEGENRRLRQENASLRAIINPEDVVKGKVGAQRPSRGGGNVVCANLSCSHAPRRQVGAPSETGRTSAGGGSCQNALSVSDLLQASSTGETSPGPRRGLAGQPGVTSLPQAAPVAAPIAGGTGPAAHRAPLADGCADVAPSAAHSGAMAHHDALLSPGTTLDLSNILNTPNLTELADLLDRVRAHARDRAGHLPLHYVRCLWRRGNYLSQPMLGCLSPGEPLAALQMGWRSPRPSPTPSRCLACALMCRRGRGPLQIHRPPRRIQPSFSVGASSPRKPYRKCPGHDATVRTSCTQNRGHFCAHG